MKEILDFKYRPEIDGLRAIAVLAVVLFHAELGVSGGYVGVDVFFVISGYLITTLITRELIQSRFSMLDFWYRRIKRIFPAAVVLVLAVLVSGWFLLLPDDYVKLADSAIYQSLMAANMYFWQHVGYFSGPAEEMPLLHTWSLAVEEQYYVIMPIVLMLCFRMIGKFNRSKLIFVILIMMIVSFALSVFAVKNMPVAAFYLLPTRAWEMLLGSLVAMLPALKAKRKVKEALSWLGLLSILGSCFFYTEMLPFPGIAALLPCVGSALFIIATLERHGESGGSSVAKLLSNRAIVFVGLISYSLYLWHWPVFAFTAYLTTSPLGIMARVGLVLLSLVFGVLSWRFVETPFRKGFIIGSRKKAFTGAVVCTLIILWVGFGISKHNGLRGRWSNFVLQAADAKHDYGYVHELDSKDVTAERVFNFGVKQSKAEALILVWGDSFAMAAMPAFESHSMENNCRGIQITHSATAPILGSYLKEKMGLAERSLSFNEAVLEYISTQEIDHVVLIAKWDSYYGERMEGRDSKEGLLHTVMKINETGAKPWIMLRPPKQPIDVPRVLARSRMQGWKYEHLLATPTKYTGLFDEDSAYIDKLEAMGAGIINPRPSFLSEDRQHYVVEKDGVILYRDRGHLTKAGALLMIKPLLEAKFSEPAKERE